MKKAIIILLVISILFSCIIMPVMASVNEIRVMVDGKAISFDVPPMIINGRTMVPLRAIFEALGATVSWDNSTKTVSAERGNDTIMASIGQYNMVVNGVKKEIDVAPAIINGRTLVPARFIAESFDCEVNWDNQNKTVYINTSSANKGITDSVTSLSLNHNYFYLSPSESVQLVCTTEPFINNPSITWKAERGVSVVDGLVTVEDDYYAMAKVTAVADNGKEAVCWIMNKSKSAAHKMIGNKYVYIKWPTILSVENAVPNAALWDEYEVETNLPELDIYHYDYNYSYLFPELEMAEKAAHDYAYYLKESGYSLIREEDDPMISQYVGTDVIYELIDTKNEFLISIKGEIASVGGTYITPILSVSIEPLSKEQESVKSPVKIIDMCGKIDSVGGVEWTYNLQNNSNKVIKYVTIKWQCYNSVKDVIADTISGATICSMTVTGPIQPGATKYGIQNDRKFYNSTYGNYIRLLEINVEYMDGSFDNNDVDYLTDYWYVDYSLHPFELALKGSVMLLNMIE